ncbi:MAG: serine hydrolase [Halieaceae bacterium]|jgi:CubicO group peptidase (beta-lactamase class C family)|nr:serine hydrolase [Halieaceae bacterium]
MIYLKTMVTALLLGSVPIQTALAAECLPPDPTLMRGFPPPVEKRVTPENLMQHPQNRWAFQHMREVVPTREIAHSEAPVSVITENPLDLDSLSFELPEGRKLSLTQWMQESCTDSFLVMHRGKLVYERYFSGMTAATPHQMFSATKSWVATVALQLIEEGRLDPGRTMVSYIPELKGSAFAQATVQQVLNMTTSIRFSEEYTDPKADIWQYGAVFAIGGTPGADYKGPRRVEEYLPTLNKGEAPHGKGFHYVTPNTDALAWINSRITGKSTSELFSERFLQPLGAEHGAYFWTAGGVEMAGGGLNISARDAARFGQMILNKGRFNGRQILAPAVAARILAPGNPDTFSVFYDDPWYQNVGYAYHDMWWTFDNAHKAVSAIGVHGQFIYLDPIANMVVIKQSSHPDAEGASNENDGPAIWHQIARHLMQHDH